VKNRNNRLYY